MTKVIYLSLRRLLPLLACLPLALLALGGCLAVRGEAQVVSPFSGQSGGPRSFESLSQQIARQSESLRDIFIQARGLYPYFSNSYRVRIRIEDDGEVSDVKILDREYVLSDFEEQFTTQIARFEFSPYEGPPVEIIYTFTFYPEKNPRLPPPAPLSVQSAPPPVPSDEPPLLQEESGSAGEPAAPEEVPSEPPPPATDEGPPEVGTSPEMSEPIPATHAAKDENERGEVAPAEEPIKGEEDITEQGNGPAADSKAEETEAEETGDELTDVPAPPDEAPPTDPESFQEEGGMSENASAPDQEPEPAP